ncbi:hypothetical protein OG948_00430 [Embleya sp. NBC_00888]|uniref:hypothetical protein n=1 Tax=Embleya sp. NBC_00888 TaxID=2975960 RepID=UPI003868A39F|nr:hypothetical protein OG948_00430 [Embleya sp. NBC_00888]
MDVDGEGFEWALPHDDWAEPSEGTDRDVRVVVAGIPLEVRDGFLYDRVPFARFAHEPGLPGELERMRSADPAAAREAREAVGSAMFHQGCRFPAGALAVPFLLRIAADPSTHDRFSVLRLCALAARRDFWDDGSRPGLLRVAYADDDVRFASDGSVQNWSIRATRDAVAADADVVIGLLEDSDPPVREMAAYALAAASGRTREISAALHERLRIEDDARVRACLVLAIAQLAHEHDPDATVAWARALWSDPTGPAEVRVSAALGWLCLVDDPAPDALRAVIEESVTPELHRLLSPTLWMRQVEDTGVDGLSHTLWQMLDPDTWPGPAPEPVF